MSNAQEVRPAPPWILPNGTQTCFPILAIIGVIYGFQGLYWGYFGIVENRMETTIVLY